jgi:pheromone a factor receptor
MTTSNHVFSAFAFMSFILVSIPLPWHWQGRNSATCLYILWVAISDLAYFIDSVVWDENIVDRSPIWCDISELILLRIPDCISLITVHSAGSRVLFAGNVAIAGACLCIQRRIYHVLSDSLANAAVTTARVRISELLWHLCSDNEFFFARNDAGLCWIWRSAFYFLLCT